MTVIGKQKFQSGDEGIINFKSSNPFEFFHILNSKESEEQDMLEPSFFQMKRRKITLL